MKKLILPLLLCWYGQTALAMEEGQAALACPAQMKDHTGTFNPEDYKGKVVLIDFWATWCGPCLQSIPFFNELHQDQSLKNLEIVAINLDEEQDQLQDFLQNHRIDYPLAYDPAGECPKAYAVKAMPSSYLVDKNGTVRHVHLGFHNSDQIDIRNRIKTLLAE